MLNFKRVNKISQPINWFGPQIKSGEPLAEGYVEVSFGVTEGEAERGAVRETRWGIKSKNKRACPVRAASSQGAVLRSRLKRSMSGPEAHTGKQDQRVAAATCVTPPPGAHTVDLSPVVPHLLHLGFILQTESSYKILEGILH